MGDHEVGETDDQGHEGGHHTPHPWQEKEGRGDGGPEEGPRVGQPQIDDSHCDESPRGPETDPSKGRTHVARTLAVTNHAGLQPHESDGLDRGQDDTENAASGGESGVALKHHRHHRDDEQDRQDDSGGDERSSGTVQDGACAYHGDRVVGGVSHDQDASTAWETTQHPDHEKKL